QHLGQRIGKISWLGELENISVGHGVSLLRWRSGGVEHPHDTPPYPFMPSPTFGLSSDADRADEFNAAVGPAVSRIGDLWLLDDHRLLRRTALEAMAYDARLGTAKAAAVF